jgi:hypothetical protein
MPIRPKNRWLYPIDWQQLSDTICFDRAGARCERCARLHLRFVAHLGDGRWWDADTGYWRSDRGRRIAVRERLDMLSVRTTYIVLACAHLDHDPGHNRAIPPHCASVAICSTMRPNTAGSAGGTSSACAHCVTYTKILSSHESASRIVFCRPGQGEAAKVRDCRIRHPPGPDSEAIYTVRWDKFVRRLNLNGG